MLGGMSVFPLVSVTAGSLRAMRSLPGSLASCALIAALRPFWGGWAVFLVYALLIRLVGRSTGMVGHAFWAFLPFCSLMSLGQAIMLRWPRMPLLIVMLFTITFISVGLPDVMKLSIPAWWLPGAGLAVLLMSWKLHLRWLGRCSQMGRLNQGVFGMPGSTPR